MQEEGEPSASEVMEIGDPNPLQVENQTHLREEGGGELPGGLLYDGTTSGHPQLLLTNQEEKWLGKYMDIPYFPAKYLHKFYTNGLRQMDEIVACSQGYLCYNLIYSNCFLIFHPGRNNSEFKIDYGDRFTGISILCVSMIVRGHGDFRLVFIVEKEPVYVEQIRALSFEMFSYIYDTRAGSVWLKRDQTLPRIGRESLPFSSCQKGDGEIYGLRFDEEDGVDNPRHILKFGDSWRQLNVPKHEDVIIEWMWLTREEQQKYRQTSPALFSYKNQLFMMSGFKNPGIDNNATERGIGLWWLKPFPPGHEAEGFTMEKVVEFPKVLWSLRMEPHYDFAQFRDSFAVFDMNHGCGRAYNYVTQRFYTFISCNLGPARSHLKAFNYEPSYPRPQGATTSTSEQ